VSPLGENDRSATGYLEPQEFETTANAFFAYPERSIRGWETAQAAQTRIVEAVHDLYRRSRWVKLRLVRGGNR